MGGFMAARMGNRMQMRQGYRTMARMQRRRTYMQNRMGMRQDFEQAGDDPYEQQQQQQAPPPPPPPAQPAAPDYTAELERLAQLVQQGVITQDDFNAKKKQILGI